MTERSGRNNQLPRRRSRCWGALAQWRRVEQRSPAASDRWFRAKYAIALLHYRLGNPQQAKKIIALLQVLHPELGGAQRKPQFLALMQKCG